MNNLLRVLMLTDPDVYDPLPAYINIAAIDYIAYAETVGDRGWRTTIHFRSGKEIIVAEDVTSLSVRIDDHIDSRPDEDEEEDEDGTGAEDENEGEDE